MELAKLWQQLQHQVYILSEITSVNEQLMLLTEMGLQVSDVTHRDEIYCGGDVIDSDIVNRISSTVATNDESIQIVSYQNDCQVKNAVLLLSLSRFASPH